MRKKRDLMVILLLFCVIFAGCANNTVEQGSELLEKMDYSQAQAKFQASIGVGKNLPEAYRGLGLCYWEQEKYEEAADAFGRALENGTKKTATIFNLMGICELKIDNPEKAVYYFEEGQNLPDGNEKLMQEMAFNAICAYEKLGDFVTAREKLEIYVESYPDDGRAEKELEFLNTQAPETEETKTEGTAREGLQENGEKAAEE